MAGMQSPWFYTTGLAGAAGTGAVAAKAAPAGSPNQLKRNWLAGLTLSNATAGIITVLVADGATPMFAVSVPAGANLSCPLSDDGPIPATGAINITASAVGIMINAQGYEQ